MILLAIGWSQLGMASFSDPRCTANQVYRLWGMSLSLEDLQFPEAMQTEQTWMNWESSMSGQVVWEFEHWVLKRNAELLRPQAFVASPLRCAEQCWRVLGQGLANRCQKGVTGQRRFICRGGITRLHGSMVDICVMSNATCIFIQATIGCGFALVVSYSRDLSVLIHGCCLCRSKFMSQRLSKNASLLWFLKSTYTVVSWHGTSID